MNETLFREKSLEKVKSPDNLGEYIRVANPGVWILLVAILFLLLGACCWGIFGSVRSVVNTNAQVADGQIICYLTEADAAKLHPGMQASIDGTDAVVAEVCITAGSHAYCVLTSSAPVSDGVYSTEIVIEAIRPISFLLN